MTQLEALQNNIDVVRELYQSFIDKRTPNKNILIKYNGFGAIKDIRRNPSNETDFNAIKSKALRAKLLEFHDLVRQSMRNNEKEYNNVIRNLQGSTLTAFYTPKEITDIFYNTYISNYDKAGYNILDPSAGTGIFTENIKNATVTSIEKDRLSAGILSAIRKNQKYNDVINGTFEDIINHPDVHKKYNLVATNAPFGNIKVSDRLYNKDKGIRKNSTKSIHNYFMLKGIDSLLPNGMMIMITSTSIADSASSVSTQIREEMILECELKNIIRLPNNTFSDAGTKANSDVYILKKRGKKIDLETILNSNNTPSLEKDFLQTNTFDLDDVSIKINKALYNSETDSFQENILGTPKVDFFNNKKTIVFESNRSKTELYSELSKQIIQAKAKNVIENIPIPPNTPPPSANKQNYGQLDIFNNIPQAAIKPRLLEFKIPSELLIRHNLQENDTYLYENNFITIQNDNKGIEINSEKFSKEEINRATIFHNLADSYDDLLEYAQLHSTSNLDTRESNKFKDFIKNYDQFSKKYGSVRHSLPNNILLNRSARKNLSHTIENSVDNEIKLSEEILKGNIADWKWKNSSPIIHHFEPRTDKTITQNLSLSDAIKKSLNQKGEINLQYISEQTGLNKKQVTEEALSNELLYPEPNINSINPDEQYIALSGDDTTYNLVTKDEFLSGAVRYKITELQSNANKWNIIEDNQINKYVTELQQIEKPFLSIDELDPQLGESWIPKQYFEQFASELFDTSISIAKSKSNLQFTLSYSSNSYEMNNTWAVKCKNGRNLRGTKLMEIAFSGSYPKITYSIPGPNNKKIIYPDRVAMLEAANKITELHNKWISFLRKNKNVGNRLENIYNNTQNLYQERKFIGQHLTFPNLQHFKPMEHQKNGAWQVIVQNGGLVDHAVGAGKTLLMAIVTMELKRLGQSNKTMIIAMKANASEIAQEFQKAYPNAKILSPLDKDLKKQNRVSFFNKMKEDWDAIILTHDQFKFIPQSRKIQQELIEDELENIRMDLNTLTKINDKAATGRQLSGLERRLQNKQAELKSIIESIVKDPDLVTFDKMGIDHLMVDESQIFKNLPFTSRHDRVAGLGNPTGSQRAFNLLVACRTIQNKLNNDKGITFLSGTPISNSLVELYLLFKYLRPRELERRGMTNFDEWARTYAKLDRDFELTVTNQIQSKERFRFFLKVPELASLYRSMSNIVTNKELSVKKPDLNIILEEVQPTEEQQNSMKKLVGGVQSGNFSSLGYHKTGDNIDKAKMLIATNLATKISLDMRLLQPDRYDVTDGSKINKLCENVINEYNKTNNDLGTQFIFLDSSTPTSKSAKEFNMYDGIKENLISQYGLNDEEIQFIHNHDTKPSRKKLFSKVNSGEVRIIIGSTQKMGTGVNMQQRCVAMHHVDIPWNPKDFTQRNGRGERQGNIIAEKYDNKVNCYVYATSNTLDAYKYYLMDLKARFIDQIKTSGKIDFRTLDEGDMDQDGKMSAASFIARLSGQEELLEKTKIDKKLSNFKALKESLIKNYNQIKTSILNNELLIPKLKHKGENYSADYLAFSKAIKVNNNEKKNKFTYTLKANNKSISNPEDIKDFFQNLTEKKDKIINQDNYLIGEVGDFKISIGKNEIASFMDGDTSKEVIYPIVITSKITNEEYSKKNQTSYYNLSPQALYTSIYYNLESLDRKAKKQFHVFDEQTEKLIKDKELIKTLDPKKYDPEINELATKSMDLHKKILKDKMDEEENEITKEDKANIKQETQSVNETKPKYRQSL